MEHNKSPYIHQTPCGEYFDIQAYEDNEQMNYLASQKKAKSKKTVAKPLKWISSALRRDLIKQR